MAKHFQIDTGGTLTTGLVSYYKLEDTTDAFGTNNLTNNGSATFGAGKVSNAVTTTASAYLNSSTLFLTSNSTFSYAFWVNLTSATLQGCFISNGTSDSLAGTGVAVGVGPSGTSATFISGTGNQLIVLCSGVAWQPTGSNIGTGWHFIVITRDGTTMKAYIDNVQTGTLTASTATPSTPSGSAWMGRGANGANNNFTFAGSIDEAGFWTKVLSTQERTDLYNSGSGQTLIASTTFTRTASASVSNASSRFATAAALHGYVRGASTSVSNAAGRLATASKSFIIKIGNTIRWDFFTWD